jgi:hypothetical protein
MGKNAFLDKENKMLIWKPIRALEIQNKNMKLRHVEGHMVRMKTILDEITKETIQIYLKIICLHNENLASDIETCICTST